jgi:hypothetical protein
MIPTSSYAAQSSLSAPGGGEGRGEVGDSRAVAGTHLTFPIAEAMGPLPLPPQAGGEGIWVGAEEILLEHCGEGVA